MSVSSESRDASATAEAPALNRPPAFHHDDFTRFKQALAQECAADARAAAVVLAAPATDLYGLAPVLGLSTAQLARRVAQFLWLPFLARITADDLPAYGANDPFCRAHQVVPLALSHGVKAFALANPFDGEAVALLYRSADDGVSIYLADPQVIHDVQAGRAMVSGAATAAEAPAPQRDIEIESPPTGSTPDPLSPVAHATVVTLVNTILAGAYRQGATDIHIEPRDSGLLVRYRVAGGLTDAMRLPNHARATAIPRLKAMAGLDPADTRQPQEGRMRARIDGRRVDLRVSTLPTLAGERVAVRLADAERVPPALGALGFAPDVLDAFRRAIHGRPGLVVVAGPDEAARTEIVHAALHELRSYSTSVVAIERQVTMAIDDVTHVELDRRGGRSSSDVLASVLAQDPNVVYIEDVSDSRTLQLAYDATQTRCLVVTTMDAPDAAAVLTRLAVLGLEPYQVTTALAGVLVERRVRALCARCAIPMAPSPQVLSTLPLDPGRTEPARWLSAAGCEACGASGYHGACTLTSWVGLSRDVRALVSTHAPEAHVRQALAREHWTTLFADGVAKAQAGLTTLDEVSRVAPQASGTSERSDPLTAVTSKGDAVPAADRTVLILEDEPDTRAAIETMLRTRGYRTLLAADGVEALLQLGRSRVDLVLSDVNMPTLDGLTFMRMMRDKGLRVPTVFLTADRADALEEECLTLGAVDFIRKPIKKDVLLLRVERAFH